jgi:hypothetical protein
LHLADLQPDANLIWLVAGRMQIIDKFGYFVLHGQPDAICIPAGSRLNEICIHGQLNEICIRLAAD